MEKPGTTPQVSFQFEVDIILYFYILSNTSTMFQVIGYAGAILPKSG